MRKGTGIKQDDVTDGNSLLQYLQKLQGSRYISVGGHPPSIYEEKTVKMKDQNGLKIENKLAECDMYVVDSRYIRGKLLFFFSLNLPCIIN